MYNIAKAWALLSVLNGEDTCECLRRAIAASKGALSVQLQASFPIARERTMHNLAIFRRGYESLGCAMTLPFDDIPPAE